MENIFVQGIDERVESIMNRDDFIERFHTIFREIPEMELDGDEEVDYIIEQLEHEFVDGDPTIPFSHSDSEPDDTTNSDPLYAAFGSNLERLFRSTFRAEVGKLYMRVHRHVLSETNPELLDDLETDGVFDVLDSQ